MIAGSKIYKLDMNSPLNDPWYHYARGGQGMHDGLGEDDRYVIVQSIERKVDEPLKYVFINISTGQVVRGTHTLDRFIVA